MDMGMLDFMLKALQFLLWAGTSFYVYISNKDKVTNERIGRLETDIDAKIDGHTERIAKIEARSEKAPTHDDLAKLYDKLNKQSECLHRLEGEFEGVKRTLQLIHETLMERR